ncbi:thioester-forming surface-anchored protein [Streptococcus ictaluri]|uniref:thioester-forming surface-anchored protein n=1 Tax=Streptococcus ictaluri TaxID=380397 RepID=UPI001F24BC9F|nr:thioester-forming surface-anchored protein [Streptococcus ictaluri]
MRTKGRRKLTVTLVGVFFILAASTSGVGVSQIVYAADEVSVPNYKSPDPEFPWYGYDAYKGIKPRYHSLKVNLNGSREYHVYCFNLTKEFPRPSYSITKNLYKKIDTSDEILKKYTTKARNFGGNVDKLSRSILFIFCCRF